MHEVRVTAPAGQGKQIADIALQAGIRQVTMYRVFAYGPDEEREIVSAETSTPLAHAFIEALFASGHFDRETSTVTSRQLRAIRSREPSAEVTQPMVIPAIDVFDDLWQLSHVTAGYALRAIAAALLMAIALTENSAIGIVVAALFAPFLSPTLALSFGIGQREWKLARQGAWALIVSIVLTTLCAFTAGAVLRGEVKFAGFHSPAINFAISLVIGIAAGVSSADDTGKQYMIGVAAAVQYAIFPAWFGLSLAVGFPDQATTVERLASFTINVITIAAAAAIVYALICNQHKSRSQRDVGV